MLFFWKKVTWTIQKYLTHTWKILRKNLSARNHPPAFSLGSYSWCVIIAFYSFSSKNKYWKIPEKKRKIQRKHLLGSKLPSRLDLWFLFMVCYPCMLFLCRQQTVLENTGQYQEHIKNNTRTKSPLCSKTTLPAIWRDGGFKLRFFSNILIFQ